MKEEKFITYGKDNIDETLAVLFEGIYTRSDIEELKESALLMDEWSKNDCFTKCTGGMEEWAKEEGTVESVEAFSCDWYHGTWQYMRLLNMVAVPRWYNFYHEAMRDVLQRKPDAHVMISACADYGMLHALHHAMTAAGARPTIIIYDICNTPLKSSEWYARKHDFPVRCFCENIITADIEKSSFDLIITDEFLTVLQNAYKPLIIEKWKKILKPGGTIVTTAMIGNPTTLELREGYAARARRLFEIYGSQVFPHPFNVDGNREKLLAQFKRFAMYHTRHMIKDELEIRQLFKDFKFLSIQRIRTPGECVNPTDSYQVTARLEE
jgi:2-polyprenyl-3-methyl-5-hydroxy-6-metoxy-1,4-benzoquinol methylase